MNARSVFEDLLTEAQREELAQVRQAMLADPKILDTHSREVRNNGQQAA